jgi:hypothetical protein
VYLGSDKFREFHKSDSEIREMLEYAAYYLKGNGSVAGLYGLASDARSYATHRDIIKLLDKWILMTDSAWNEWGINKNPISEDALKEWIKGQLAHNDTIPPH